MNSALPVRHLSPRLRVLFNFESLRIHDGLLLVAKENMLGWKKFADERKRAVEIYIRPAFRIDSKSGKAERAILSLAIMFNVATAIFFGNTTRYCSDVRRSSQARAL